MDTVASGTARGMFIAQREERRKLRKPKTHDIER
jgi:hypothetical protein